MNAFKQALVGTYSDSDTVIELNSISDTPGDPDYLVSGVPLILYDSLFGNPADSNNAGDYEIVLVTGVNYATNEITVTRAQESTTAQTIGAGWSAVYGLTQAVLDGKVNVADIVNDLTTGGTDVAFSAEQGKVLQDTKQANLVSGTNIKTINSESLLGSGDLEIGGGKVLQVVFAETSTTASTSSGAPTDTGLSGSITPESQSSIIYIIIDQQFSLQATSGRLRLIKGSDTQLGNQITINLATSSVFEDFTVGWKRKDVHGVETEITYKTQMMNQFGTAVRAQRVNDSVTPTQPTTSTMMIIEVEPPVEEE